MPGRKTITTDDRGASVAVNHVLAIGITTILISGLLLSAATLLRDQRSQSAEPELRKIGNRIASHIAEGERLVEDSNDVVTFRLDQPSRIAGSGYQIRIGSGQCPGPYQQPVSSPVNQFCIFVESGTVGELTIPLNVDLAPGEIDIDRKSGGEYEIKVCEGGCP